jgi:hypothetical protein
MALTESAGLLFKFRAEGASQIKTEMATIQSAAGGATASLSSLAGPAAIAAGAIAAVGLAALHATDFLWDLTKAASEYGSVIFDAKEKTGLTAETISTLKFAADNAGSSLDTVTSGVAKFAKLLGQAREGNEQAQATLKQLGVTTYDLDAALQQVYGTIYRAKEGTDQLVLSQKAFGKAGAEQIPVIKQFGGDLAAAKKEADRLALTLSESDVKAADEFGDTLGTLQAQVKTLASRFALEFAPEITKALSQVIGFLARNQDVAREWGREIADVIHGVIGSFTRVESAVEGILDAIGIKFTSNASRAKFWASAILAAINPVLDIARRLGVYFGKTDPKESQEGGGFVPSSAADPGGGGGKGGGGGGANKAEERRKKAVEQAQKEMRDKLAIYHQTAEEAAKIEEERLSRGEIDEFESMKRIRALKEREAKYEATLLLNFSRNANLNAEEKAEAEMQVRIATSKVRVEELTTQIAINKEYDAANRKLGEAIEFQKEQVRLEEERLKKLKDARQQKQLEYDLDRKKRREEIDPFGVGHKKKGANGDLDWDINAGGDLITGVAGSLGVMQQQLPVLQQVGQMLVGTFNQIAEAVGNAVKSFVLFGTAGGSFRKFAAEVIASIAQTAIVQAVYELAQGLAMLALFHFTHNPKYAKSATTHFASAAVFGTIGGIAAGAGRLVAGNSFASDSGGGGGSGGGATGNSSNNDRTNYGGQFSGFGNSSGSPVAQMIAALRQSEETNNKLYEKITSMPAEHVVAIGADGASRELTRAIHGELQTGSGPTEGFQRGFGNAR